MQSPVSQGVDWFHPGEVLVVARVARDATAPARLHAAVADLLARNAANHVLAEPDSLRSIVFDAPGERHSLAFLFQKLARRDGVRHVKDTVRALHEQVGDLRNDEVEVLGVMPHWHTRAHEMSSGGSPGSLPAPVPPTKIRPGRRWRYQPKVEPLRLVDGGTPIPVAVLDTRLDLGQVPRFDGNDQLQETVEWLQKHAKLPGELSQREWAEVAKHHAEPEANEPERYVMADHGLFVAGLIHGLAPTVPVSLVPVLDEYGVGDLSLLLAALRELLSAKPENAPLIVNLSLGFRPHPAHLVAAWNGLNLNDPTYRRAPVMFDAQRGSRWASSHGAQAAQETDLLQAGLSELGRYLSLNNCLVVAAAGNDSHAGELRLDPRLPARFETVLGVAATATDPMKAASYSNVGDEQRRGDHVATFGGERDAAWAPVDGVISLYSGAFPSGEANTTGWAHWSGTSFATGLVSGMAANVWARKPEAHASEVLADVHELALRSGPYVNELRTPSIDVEGDWT